MAFTEQQRAELEVWLTRVEADAMAGLYHASETVNAILKIADWPRPYVLDFKKGTQVDPATVLQLVACARVQLRKEEKPKEAKILPFRRKSY